MIVTYVNRVMQMAVLWDWGHACTQFKLYIMASEEDLGVGEWAAVWYLRVDHLMPTPDLINRCRSTS
ncbi:hypothetical protein OPV22_015474 [Ensete ventricosum]|uniref:Uncharacterized protein n=1 Tax=Ensete ventricosum TaxID=4639 RepID=A0AAV8RC09_ENSVE|nr:hypothetical protein OPV22_015474 [Ensete ventricosum]